MKKKYEKPIVLIEDYSMSEICAGSPCEEKLNFADGDVCHSWLTIGGEFLFNKANDDCLGGWMDDPDFKYDGVCYHGPENRNFFTS